ncbi:MAG: hypothetical protein ABIQ39_11375 [Ilumatobacteraceae bacterium]
MTGTNEPTNASAAGQLDESAGVDGAAASSTAVLAATIAGAVARQVSQQLTSMSSQITAQIDEQVSDARRSAELIRSELQLEFGRQLEVLAMRIESHQQANEAYQRALQTALEERLVEFANHQHERLTTIESRPPPPTPLDEGRVAELEARVEALADDPRTSHLEAQLAALIDDPRTAELEARITALADDQRLAELEGRITALAQDPRTAELEARITALADDHRLAELEMRVTALPDQLAAGLPDIGDAVAGATAELQLQLDGLASTFNGRIEELQRSARRFDEQSSALVQHVNDSSTVLAQQLAEKASEIAADVDARFTEQAAAAEAINAVAQRQITDQLSGLTQRIDSSDSKTTDRLLEVEERINEAAGTKIAALEATIGRVGAGFDDALVAMSQRFLDAENGIAASNDVVAELAERVATVDENAIAEVKEQMSSAVGEAMLVRIEMDRVVQTTDEKLDRQGLRMAEIEAQLADHMDTSTAVQLDRLDELERAIAELDPDQFVRRDGTTSAASTTTSESASFSAF